jgi:hypothetical protein
MRRAWPALVLLAGCPSAPPFPQVPVGTLAVGAATEPTGDYAVDQFALTVDQLVVDADGPSGPESVAVLLDHTFEPLTGREVVGFSLEQGDHDHAVLSLSILDERGPGIVCSGVVDEDKRVRVEVDAIDLQLDLGRVTIGPDPLIGHLRLDPEAWLRVAWSGEDGGDDGGAWVVGPSSPKYQALLDAIVDTTTFDFDPAGPSGGSTSDE